MVQNNFKQPFQPFPHTRLLPKHWSQIILLSLLSPGPLVPSLWYSQKTWSLFLAPSAGYPKAFGPWVLVLNLRRQRTVSERKLKPLDGLYIVGREKTLAAILAETLPPGFVHCFHVHDDVPRLKGNLCVILWKEQSIQRSIWDMLLAWMVLWIHQIWKDIWPAW